MTISHPIYIQYFYIKVNPFNAKERIRVTIESGGRFPGGSKAPPQSFDWARGRTERHPKPVWLKYTQIQYKQRGDALKLGGEVTCTVTVQWAKKYGKWQLEGRWIRCV